MLRGIREPFVVFGGSSRLALVVALGLALVTGMLIFNVMRNAETGSSFRSAGSVVLTPVVTAATSIPAGTLITPSMLEVSSVSAESLLPGALTETQLAVGRIARIPVLRGEQVIEAKLTVVGSTGTGLAHLVPEGHRAMAIRVDKVIGAGGLVRPGDRVDVFGVVTTPSGPQTRLVAQNIEVLAIEQSLENVLPTLGGRGDETLAADGTLVDQPEAQPSGTVATLALTPSEAERVLFVESSGLLRLAVRAPGDNSVLAMETDLLFGADASAVGEDTSLSYVVPEGLRAMGVETTKVIGAGGLIRPGDRVDIIAVLEVETIGGGSTLQRIARSVTIGQYIEVLAVEQALARPAEDGTEGAAEQAGAQPSATVVTLALTPELAQQVLLAEEQGVIRLTVRPAGDDEIVILSDTAFFSIANTTGSAELFQDLIR